MKKELIALFFINILSAIGYSLIAPLFPPLARERDLKEYTVGFIISLYAISNFLVTPFAPQIISKYGRKKVFYIATIMEAVCTWVYALLSYVDHPGAFIFISIVARFMNGVASSFVTILGKFKF
jgi:DHA1 family multidrug resistance protein-like MFS transporter